MQRSVGVLALLFTAVSAILGSGWLFSAYYASQIAGPAALLSWVIAAVAIIFVAFVFAELTAMLPVMGASTRIPHVTHGTVTGFMYAWIIWLCYASIPPTEVQAIIQYVSYYHPALTRPGGALTQDGYILATLLMLLIAAINAFSLRWLLRCNTALTFMKIIIPLIIVAIVIAYYFEPHRLFHPDHSAFMPTGIKGILSVISTGGMIYAFNGFTQACEWGGAVKKPGVNLPIAIVGSVALTLVVYAGLQIAFLISLEPHNFAHGWSTLTLERANSPLAAILMQDRLSQFIPVLFVAAMIGPFAAALVYTSGAAQSLRSKSINGYLPQFLQILSEKHVPIYAVAVNFAFGMLLFAPLPGWNKMMNFLTSLMAFTYTVGPICLIALREQVPNQFRPFRLPFGKIWATIAFYFCTAFSYFNGWDIISKLSIGFLVGLLVLLLYRALSKNQHKQPMRWRSSLWIWPYVLGLTLISYLGSFGGGKNILPFGWDLLVLFIFTTSIVWLARRFKLSSEDTQKYIEKMAIEH
ncbi:MAG: amino acid permease [Gammaproteobacteria bacterium RIFCSPLOWO2_02_FULL_42_14]|nr:MAG: amino acid permease [Gammaproteobacteria bacterium RIFCSPHIGHO2_02_FULL_42_43]OGT52773.1 MAG: amino acid permease [Gammaproteobacteria bacterium RIFCSPHIGHO2_12_FULL_41_25]OGT63308.1 MAG: amino acid permease [Gammaproteobacteria bacterium RIFCSPLOWO2_02_FULL_42_14]OGT86896.1 MAG: amino acid permease [Gammaproteobacteria bacterium RIFCSPLOWO2_12_FULL_42_18]